MAGSKGRDTEDCARTRMKLSRAYIGHEGEPRKIEFEGSRKTKENEHEIAPSICLGRFLFCSENNNINCP